jgi:hypothetical protein
MSTKDKYKTRQLVAYTLTIIQDVKSGQPLCGEKKYKHITSEYKEYINV